jgi:hypothetical protein
MTELDQLRSKIPDLDIQLQSKRRLALDIQFKIEEELDNMKFSSIVEIYKNEDYKLFIDRWFRTFGPIKLNDTPLQEIYDVYDIFKKQIDDYLKISYKYIFKKYTFTELHKIYYEFVNFQKYVKLYLNEDYNYIFESSNIYPTQLIEILSLDKYAEFIKLFDISLADVLYKYKVFRYFKIFNNLNLDGLVDMFDDEEYTEFIKEYFLNNHLKTFENTKIPTKTFNEFISQAKYSKLIDIIKNDINDITEKYVRKTCYNIIGNSSIDELKKLYDDPLNDCAEFIDQYFIKNYSSHRQFKESYEDHSSDDYDNCGLFDEEPKKSNKKSNKKNLFTQIYKDSACDQCKKHKMSKWINNITQMSYLWSFVCPECKRENHMKSSHSDGSRCSCC